MYGHGRTEGRRGDGDGANLITTSSEQITREGGERRRERVTVEVKRDKIDRRHDVAVANGIERRYGAIVTYFSDQGFLPTHFKDLIMSLRQIFIALRILWTAKAQTGAFSPFHGALSLLQAKAKRKVDNSEKWFIDLSGCSLRGDDSD